MAGWIGMPKLHYSKLQEVVSRMKDRWYLMWFDSAIIRLDKKVSDWIKTNGPFSSLEIRAIEQYIGSSISVTLAEIRLQQEIIKNRKEVNK